MKYCKNCKVNVDADRNYCPLCFRELKTLNEESVGEYPFMERRKNEHVTQSTHLLLKIFLFLSVSIISVCTLVNMLINPETLWCLLVSFSLIYVWILVAHTILSRRGVFEKIFMQLVGVMLILWACEILSLNKEHWLANYVFPSVSMATVATMLMCTFIRRDKSWILAFVFIILVLTVASVLFFVYLDEFYILSIINLAFCALSLLGYFTFSFKVIKAEFLKKFHL